MRASMEASGNLGKLPTRLSDSEALTYFFGWQYAAATAIAEAVMMAEWVVETESGGEWEAAPDHPMSNLLKHPNDILTSSLLWYYAVLDLAMIGKHYWQIAKNSMGEPAELWPLPGKLTPHLDEEKKLDHWKQEVIANGKLTDKIHPADEIVFLRFPEPQKILDGMGPAQAAGSQIKLSAQVTESEWAVMKQGIWPSAILTIPDTDAEDRDEIIKQFDAKWAGAKKHGKVIGIGSDVGVSWPPLKPREMGYDRASDRLRDTILGIMRVPAAILGRSADVNRASAEALNYIFAKWTIAPKLIMLQEQVNHDIAPKFDSTGKLRLRFLDIVPQDEAATLAREQMELSTWTRTINEYCAEHGLAEKPYGDVPLVPAGIMPLGEAAAQDTQTINRETIREVVRATLDGLDSPSTGSPAGVQAKAPTDAVRRQARPSGRPIRERQIIALAFDQARAGLQAELTAVFQAHFVEVETAVLEAWDKANPEQAPMSGLPAEMDRALTPELMAERMAAMAEPVNRAGIALGGTFEASVTPLAAIAEEWGPSHAAVSNYAAAYSAEHYSGIAAETRRRMTTHVAAGIVAHKTWGEMRGGIVQEFGAMKESRAANIATTESTKLFGAGGQAFRDVAGIPNKQWIVSWINTRDSHAAADGQIVKNGAKFKVGADHMDFPGAGGVAAENCNCNCCAVASFSLDDDTRPDVEYLSSVPSEAQQAAADLFSKVPYGGDTWKHWETRVEIEMQLKAKGMLQRDALPISDALRTWKKGSGEIAKRETVEDTVRADILQDMASHSTVDDKVLYRGLTWDTKYKRDKFAKAAKEGSNTILPRMASASAERSEAMDFATGQHAGGQEPDYKGEGVLLVIRQHEGVKIPGLNVKNVGGYRHEAEVILPEGLQLRVSSVVKDETWGVTIIELETTEI